MEIIAAFKQWKKNMWLSEPHASSFWKVHHNLSLFICSEISWKCTYIERIIIVSMGHEITTGTYI
jgi:hypothetical protein